MGAIADAWQLRAEKYPATQEESDACPTRLTWPDMKLEVSVDVSKHVNVLQQFQESLYALVAIESRLLKSMSPSYSSEDFGLTRKAMIKRLSKTLDMRLGI